MCVVYLLVTRQGEEVLCLGQDTFPGALLGAMESVFTSSHSLRK